MKRPAPWRLCICKGIADSKNTCLLEEEVTAAHNSLHEAHLAVCRELLRLAANQTAIMGVEAHAREYIAQYEEENDG
jgi:ribosomal protein S14